MIDKNSKLIRNSINDIEKFRIVKIEEKREYERLVDEKSVIRKLRITAGDGKSYNTNFYNLDAIISVGYRVNIVRATQLS